MPRFDILRRSTPSQSYRVAKVRAAYDLRAETVQERFVGDLDLPADWEIGAIVGRSGTGKSTIARELWPEACGTGESYGAASVIDDFPADLADDEVFRLLHRVGFGSVPSWLKPYSVLSQGERMRVDLARTLAGDAPLVVFDEFTSTVDRDVARFGCAAVGKAIRGSGKRFVAVSCHDDFLDWLAPDWVFSTDDMTAKKKPGAGWRCASRSIAAPGNGGASLGSITISVGA